MLYHLSEYLNSLGPSYSFLRLTQYTTFRTIIALLTSFAIILIFGRWVIVLLYRKGVRDTVRDYSVIDANSKRGTPTMGGILLIGGLALSALIWCDLTNPMVWYLFASLVWFAFVGGLDDYMKIKYSHSDKGLSRTAKYAMQGGFGLVLGVMLLVPGTSSFPTAKSGIWKSYERRCSRAKRLEKNPVAQKNARRSLEGAKADALFVPFYKYPVLNLGWFYVLVVIFMMVFSANAVNFIDGLDGLAIVPTLLSFLVYGVYAYLLGHMCFAGYLFLPHIPGAGEVAVFAGAATGAGLGFLWFNAYPAEVFMGDTGSMALGGVLGTTMVLLKQEVLFFLLGGVFLAEILSVVVQDWVGIQVLGRRLMYRAPIHHTFQHRGLSEPKIAVRFWIVAGVLALLSLVALKVR